MGNEHLTELNGTMYLLQLKKNYIRIMLENGEDLVNARIFMSTIHAIKDGEEGNNFTIRINKNHKKKC